MLGPRDIEISALFLFFVALPLVAYFLLGKWSEATKRKNRISLIANRAVEEALRVEDMAVGCIIPMVSVPTNGFHQCARCFGAATTRCSHCKSVWYCSGGCQITHWRQVHKLECHQLGNNCKISSLNFPTEGPRVRISADETTDPDIFGFNVKRPSLKRESSGDINSPHRNPVTYSSGMKIDKSGKHVGQRSINKSSSSLMNRNADQEILFSESGMVKRRSANSDETKGLNYSSEKTLMTKAKPAMHSRVEKLQKSAKSAVKMSKSVSLQENKLVANLEITRTMGLPKSVKLYHQPSEDRTEKQQKVQMLFPYEDFVKCFQLEVLNASPKGLVNCGNSCYANAVLQCLTSTKPLVIYLLRQSHSRAGCDKAWCLMCELERHIMMIRESGYPLSPGKILLYIRSLNSQIGDGSQEDAHEFLRLIIASMQSICLEGLGGEKAVDPWLQNTTFVQHTFGGLLRSKVKCLRCHHESVRHENIMDLTLEIFGRVESLEDALAQFTSSEDLDGDNMYRCGRCAAYVCARKQLSIMEAPNILTIVLKRFQEGNYGKINKSIRFPEMLDMIPFMTGTDDLPPLYMLYAVVVHLNTSNSSFSGHYISYVKDLSGNWFKIDDTEVQPVGLDEVMSEGAYILFYMRSYPRPARGGRVRNQQSHTMPKQCSLKLEKSSEPEQSQLRHNYSRKDPVFYRRGISLKGDRSRSPITSNCSEFADTSSSDWSLFTSSDDASCSTESTRDSFSILDYPDYALISSLYQSLYPSVSPPSPETREPMLPDQAELGSSSPPWYEVKASNLKLSYIPLIKEKEGMLDMFEVVLPCPEDRAHHPPPRFITTPEVPDPELIQVKRLSPGNFYLTHKGDLGFIAGNPSSHKHQKGEEEGSLVFREGGPALEEERGLHFPGAFRPHYRDASGSDAPISDATRAPSTDASIIDARGSLSPTPPVRAVAIPEVPSSEAGVEVGPGQAAALNIFGDSLVVSTSRSVVTGLLCDMVPDRDLHLVPNALDIEDVGAFATQFAVKMVWGGEVINLLTRAHWEASFARQSFDEVIEHHTELEMQLEELEAIRVQERRVVEAQREALEAQGKKLTVEKATLAVDKEALTVEKKAVEAEFEALSVEKVAVEVKLGKTRARAEGRSGACVPRMNF
ncbi:hypothetical protein F511_30141 [Dorcoceras hygrometricum]|uniref:ubiquitinyl hydrolase 1 n=1 Tax=Dorcoceras hygrometricum TaxID=472368 RepID=A0A2Z7CM72_9LAMI|nr:hypothetical protein F511_30141 [Dorcoceras hygrometricum]